MVMTRPKSGFCIRKNQRTMIVSVESRKESSQCCSQQGGHCSSSERTFVDHTYYDHLNDLVDDSSSKFLPDHHCKQNKGPEGRVITVSFPVKLHQMLSSVVKEDLDDIVSWQPHGRCFLVHKRSDFVSKLLPRFFCQSKLTSFQRQLNLYGFIRLTAGRDRGAYYHQLFLRGRPDLCRHMIRTRVKGTGKKAASSPTTEPKFYAMEPCPESAQSVLSSSPISHDYDACPRDHSTPSVSDATLTPRNSTLDLEELKFAMDITTLPDQFCPMDNFIPQLAQTHEPHVVVSLHPSPRNPKVCFTSSLANSHSSVRAPPQFLGSTASLRLKKPLDCEKDLLKDCGEDSFSHGMDADFVASDSKTMQDGDEVIFEGLKFTYLDHLGMDDF